MFSSPNYDQLVTLPFSDWDSFLLRFMFTIDIMTKAAATKPSKKEFHEIDLAEFALKLFFDFPPKPYNQIKPLSSMECSWWGIASKRREADIKSTQF